MYPIGLAGFIQHIYTVREDDSYINLTIFSFNSSLNVEVNLNTFDETAMEGINFVKLDRQL